MGANFKINLDAQNAGNGISRLQISKISRGRIPPDPPTRRCQNAAVRLDVWIRLCVVHFIAYSVTTVNFTCTSEHDFENQKTVVNVLITKLKRARKTFFPATQI